MSANGIRYFPHESAIFFELWMFNCGSVGQDRLGASVTFHKLRPYSIMFIYGGSDLMVCTPQSLLVRKSCIKRTQMQSTVSSLYLNWIVFVLQRSSKM